jgi:hypothetical protein
MFSSDIITERISNENAVFFPIGHKCSSAMALKNAGMRHLSLPFDWCEHLFPKKVIEIFEDNFEKFIPDAEDDLVCVNTAYGYYHKNEYDVHVCHIDIDIIAETIASYKRRILRAIDLLNGTKTLLFLYVNEGYLWNKEFRNEDFNKNTFEELVELDTYIKKRYPQLKYKILFIDFVKHDVPETSNIVNMVIQSTDLYDVHIDSVVADFRIHCSKLLQATIKLSSV